MTNFSSFAHALLGRWQHRFTLSRPSPNSMALPFPVSCDIQTVMGIDVGAHLKTKGTLGTSVRVRCLGGMPYRPRPLCLGKPNCPRFSLHESCTAGHTRPRLHPLPMLLSRLCILPSPLTCLRTCVTLLRVFRDVGQPYADHASVFWCRWRSCTATLRWLLT